MKKLAREVCIVGVGMHKFGKFVEKSLKDLTRVACWEAIHDAGIDANLIEAAYFSNVLAGLVTGQEGVRGQVFLRGAGFEGIPIVNVEGACASATIALREAAIAIAAGFYDVVLSVGAEKLYLADTSKSIEQMAANSDVELMGGLGFQFTGAYAMTLRKYMKEYGWTQLHFAKVASKNKTNGSLNPMAQYHKPMTPEEILSSRLISWPLTLYMCSTIADGAAAAIVCAKEVATKITQRQPINIRACCLRSGKVTGEDDGQREVAQEGYEMAGLGPRDIEIAEVHDAMAPGEMFRIVKLGFCEAQEAGRLVDEGYFRLSGELPVNTSGGLAARGHPIGATGLAQVCEIVYQLRGEAGPRQVKGRNNEYPRVGLAQNSGGYIEGSPGALTVTVLTR
jgi:acetyl-CoA acyltransferase